MEARIISSMYRPTAQGCPALSRYGMRLRIDENTLVEDLAHGKEAE